MVHFCSSMKLLILIGLVVGVLLQVSCKESSPPEEKWIHELEKSQQIAENAQQQVDSAVNQAQNAQQQASFLKGFLMTGILVALCMGVAIGSKAKYDSIHNQEAQNNGQSSRKTSQ